MVKCSVFKILIPALVLAPLASPVLLGTRDSTLQTRKRSRDAYVILQYGDYHLGARVLGQTLLDTGTTMDRVALCTETVSDGTKEILRADGWIVKSVGKIHNPNEGQSSRGNYFSGAYSKLHAWNMTEYERVVYLDSDILVLTNIDHLFDCGTFCASYRHSDLLNSGVMVIEPSTAVFNDMLRKAPFLPSYTGGDQGFFNVYFKELIHAPYFNWSDSRRNHQHMRMPAGLNANIAIYYTNEQWKFAEGELKVIHFTMGPIKPWVWWAHRLFDLNWKWTNVRMKLSSHGHTSGLILFWAPYPLVFLFIFAIKLFYPTSSSDYSIMKMLKCFNERYSHFVPLHAVCLSYYVAFSFIVPTTMLPSQAEYVFWLWSSFFLLLFMGTYCSLCHAANKLQTGNLSKKIGQTLVLFGVFTFSHIIHAFVPQAVWPFSTRIAFFLILSALHLVIGQFAGQAVIDLWTQSRKSSSVRLLSN